MAENIITVSGLKKSYGRKLVLDDISMKIPAGSVIGLLGPNGCGKTTLLKILAGLIKDYDGTVKINNEEIGVETKEVVAFLPDASYLPGWMTPTDAIGYFADFYKDFDKAKAEKMTRDFNLDPKQKLKTMSKGQQEKLCLILVLCRQAKLYILDEPLGGLDPSSRAIILDLIMNNYAKNSTIIISTHLINDVERIFNRVLMISQGKLLVNSHVDEIRKHGKTVQEVFLEVFPYVW